MPTAAGIEIAKHRAELENVLIKIMDDHSKRCKAEGSPCEWVSSTIDTVLCDLERSLEHCHVRLPVAA